MLTLISLGLSDEKDMSLKALEAARSCDSLYAEFYTTQMNTTSEKISKLIGKEAKELKRKDLEDHAEKILEEAQEKNVGILVGGDALVATTHVMLLLEARKKGIPARVIHGSSIHSAVAESGLQLYTFGKTTTIAFPQENYSPTSCYETIAENRKRGLHTLVLLDVHGEEKRYMTVREGLELLLDIEQKKQLKLFHPQEKIVSLCALGSDDPEIRYETIENLMKNSSQTPAVLIVPGNLHFMEKEFLETL